MDREEMRAKINEYRELVKEVSDKNTREWLEIDKHVLFMAGLYTMSTMSLPQYLDDGERELSVLRGLVATHIDLGIKSLKHLLEREEVHA